RSRSAAPATQRAPPALGGAAREPVRSRPSGGAGCPAPQCRWLRPAARAAARAARSGVLGGGAVAHGGAAPTSGARGAARHLRARPCEGHGLFLSRASCHLRLGARGRTDTRAHPVGGASG